MIQELGKESYYTGRFTNAETYKREMERSVSFLVGLSEGVSIEIESRIEACNALIDAYVNQTGTVPEPNQIQMLANWLLLEELTNTHPDKVTREEYPIMNKRQLRKRYERERCNENIEEGTSNVGAFPKAKQTQLFRRQEMDK